MQDHRGLAFDAQLVDGLLGVLIGSFRRLRALLEPLLEFFRAIPPPVLVPLLMLLPGASPQIMTGVRQCLSIGLILMVISEMFGSSSGLGFTIVLFQRAFAVPEMWSGIAVLGLIGIGLSFISQTIERRVLRWYHGLREVQRDS